MGQIVFQATLGGQTALVGQNTASSYSLTLPLATDTLVGKATTDTLTNKTLTSPVISSIVNTGTLTLPTVTDTLVGRATTDTLTNKTISGSSNTISNISLTSSVTGTLPVGNGGTGLTTLTSGYIPYGNGTSAFGSSSNLYWDSVNLGLGTGGTNNNYAGYTTLTINNTSGGIVDFNISGVRTGSIFTDSTGLNLQTRTALPTIFTTNGTEKMRLTSAGYLGIGTSSPVATLDVNGDIRLRDTYALYMASGAEQKIFAAGTANNTYLTFNQWTGSAYTERMRIDSSGNLGLGVTPNTSWSAWSAIQTGLTTAFAGSKSNPYSVMASNWYSDGSNDRYLTNNVASMYIQLGQQHQWRYAASGSAGGVISWTQAMTLDNSGRLLLGTTSASGSNYLQVNSDALISGLTVGKGGGGDIFSTALGTNALLNNTSGISNTAVGRGSLGNNTTGSGNAAFAKDSLVTNTTGSNNSAFGYGALSSNTLASNNTAVGYQSLYSNSNASNNTAFGYQAAYSNVSGSYITAFGYKAANAYNSTTTICAVGFQALALNTTGADNTAIGTYNALGANTTGSNNTAVGREALQANTTASNNTAVGYQAGYSGTTAPNSVFVGYQAGYSGAGYSTMIGYQAGYSTTEASTGSVFVGYNTGYANTTGYAHAALGQRALQSNTTGLYNTAIGHTALQANTTANFNSALGYQALYANTTGQYNVAVGSYAINAVTTSSNNTAIGHQAGNNCNPSGVGDNVFVGAFAGSNLTSGTKGIYIGSGTLAGAATNSSEIVIGYNTTGKGASTGFINPNSGGVYQGNNSTLWSVTSDQRLKKNIVDNNVGLDKISQIRVRNFEYRLPEEITEVSQDQAINKTGIQLGAIAQELQQVLPECVKQESTGIYTVDADPLIWYLVNAVKELKAEIDQLKGVK